MGKIFDYLHLVSATDTSLSQHDRKYHREGYNGGQCEYRDKMAIKDKSDKIDGKGNSGSYAREMMTLNAVLSGSLGLKTEIISQEEAKKRLSKLDRRGIRTDSVVTPEEDAVYMEAVRNGDMDTAFKMVREAAAKAMPNTKVIGDDGLPKIVYHGGGTYKSNKVGFGELWFSSNEGVAKGYGKGMACFVNIERPAEYFAGGNSWEDVFGTSEYDEETGEEKGGISTDDLVRKHLDAEDVDGVIIRDVQDDGSGSGGVNDDYIPLWFDYLSDSKNVKSADPVTYDDDGNVIPLSQRFNLENDDIRFQIVGNDNVVRFKDIVDHADEKTMNEFSNAVDQDLLNAYRNCKENGTRKNFGQIVKRVASEQLRMAIKHILGIDIEGFSIRIDADHLKHIDVEHGENGRADTSMKNDEDVARMGYVLDNPDQVSLGMNQDGTPRLSIFNNADGTQAKTLLIRKRVNGNYYVTEAVIDSKKKQIRITGAYKNNGRDPQELMAENSAPIIRLDPTLPKSATTEEIVPKKGDECQGATEILSPDGKVAGWYDRRTGGVTLVDGLATAKTVAHEIGWHATFHWVEKNHPQLHAKLVEYAKTAPDGITKSVKERYGRNLSEDELLDEIGAERFTREHLSALLEHAQRKVSEGWFDNVEGEQNKARRAFIEAHKGDFVSKSELDEVASLPPSQAVSKLVELMLNGRRFGSTAHTESQDGAEFIDSLVDSALGKLRSGKRLRTESE